MLGYINPFSDTFILKVAFIPADGYFQTKIDELLLDVQQTNPDLANLIDTIQSIFATENEIMEWQGIKADFTQYGIGEITIISPIFLHQYGTKIKMWISGIIYLFMAILAIKRITNIINA